jgi:hypothetical protein
MCADFCTLLCNDRDDDNDDINDDGDKSYYVHNRLNRIWTINLESIQHVR